MPSRCVPATDLVVPSECDGQRFDRVLARLLPQFSRSRLQQWIRSGAARIGDRTARPRDAVRAGARIRVVVPVAPAAPSGWSPAPIPLALVHEDEHLLVVDKPPGLVVHPGAGNPRGTLVNALVHHYPTLAELPRAGIVHRLDKDTSGLLVVARTLPAHNALVKLLAARDVRREYLALVQGAVTAGGRVDAPIGRHPTHRTRMAVVPSGRAAISHYRVEERLPGHTLLRVCLHSGRTHQIRVHLAHLGYPVVGDPQYGKGPRLPRASSEALANALRGFRRQALHATRLALEHPESGEAMSWEVAPPADLRSLLDCLRAAAPG